MVLRAAQLFFADQGFLQRTKFLDGQVDDLPDRLRGGARVNGHHAGIGVRRKLAEDGVSEPALLANVLEQARGHAAAQQIIEDRKPEAVLMHQRNRRYTDAKVHLFEVALFFEKDGRLRVRRAVVVSWPGGLERTKFALHQFHHPVVRDIACGRNDQVELVQREFGALEPDRKSTRLNSSHTVTSYAVF